MLACLSLVRSGHYKQITAGGEEEDEEEGGKKYMYMYKERTRRLNRARRKGMMQRKRMQIRIGGKINRKQRRKWRRQMV